MDSNERYAYNILMPLQGPDGNWFTVARALTPEGAAEVVRALLANPDPHTMQVKVEMVRQL